MRLSQDNAYPLLMFHATLPPSNALNEEQHTKMLREGYSDTYIPKQYPMHVAIGGMKRVPNNDGDYYEGLRNGIAANGTYTVIPETVIVRDKAEHDALLVKLAAENPAEAPEPARRGPGRPKAELVSA